MATLLVGRAVDGRQQLLAEAAGFFQHGVEQVAAVRLAIAQARENFFGTQHVIQGETQVVEWGLVSGHGDSWSKGDKR